MRRAAVLLALALAGCGGSDAGVERAAPVPAAPAGAQDPAAGPITRGGLREHLDALQAIADRSGGNRAAGRSGERRTADHVAAALRRAGWRVRFETVRFPFFAERRPPRVGDLRARLDVRTVQFSAAGSVRGRARPFDTLGCRAAELGRLRRSDVVLLPRGTCTFATKARAVERAGGGALVIVDRGAERPFSGSLGGPTTARIPVLAASAQAGARLARSAGPLSLRVDTVSERRRTRNVLAETAPARRVVMAGAHLDSVAEGPGINDDGSGIAALLEIAERLRDRPGLRLGFWAAEEVGLRGSRRYVRGLDRAERNAIAAYVNLDMIGSPRPRPEVYDTDDAVERVLRAAYPGTEGETAVRQDSDHAPFRDAGIAVGGLFTGASRRTDPCYHRACDTVRNVDAAMHERMARAAQDALTALLRRR